MNYNINTIKIEETVDLNISNLFRTKIDNKNIINKHNIAFELNNTNSSYLILYYNQKYLINKLSNTLVITNLLNRQSQVVKNNDTFKLGFNNYMLYNSSLLIPMINKKIFDNNYGTTFNMYYPNI